jgi:Flp pilus assembly protein TadG
MRREAGPRKLTRALARFVGHCLGLKNQEGGAVLEFALMVPPLVLVLTGCASFAMAFYTLQEMQNAVSAAAQSVASQGSEANDPCNTMMTTVQASLPTLLTSNLNYSLTVTGSAGTTTYSTKSGGSGGNAAFSCTAAGGNGAQSTEMEANTPVALSVTYAYTWMTIVPTKFFSPTTPLTVSETAMAD